LKDIRICFVGDSFVNGTGDSMLLGWTGRVCQFVGQQFVGQQGISLTYYNLGIRRETSADIGLRWQFEVLARLPDACDGRVVFSFGANDTTWEQGRVRVPIPDSLRYAGMMLLVAKRRYSVLMVSPPPLANAEQNQRTAELVQAQQQMCKGFEIPYLDVFTPLHKSPIWMREVRSRDGAHPDAAGYCELAQLVLNWPSWTTWFADRFSP